jgi:histidinol-phosphate/aromatic aminotransferase/cobyric acid decarboxylase-like protein
MKTSSLQAFRPFYQRQNINNILGSSNHNKFKGYPDRHILHYQLMIKLFGSPFPSIHFQLVNTMEEAYEPIARVLSVHNMQQNWDRAGAAPLAESSNINDLKKIFESIIFVSRSRNAVRRLFRLISYYLPKETIAVPDHKNVATELGDVIDLLTPQTKVLIVDNSRNDWMPEAISTLADANNSIWIVVHTLPGLNFDKGWCERLVQLPNLILVHEFPRRLKLVRESPSAVLLARPELICQMQALAFVVWYNMDFIHTQILLEQLELTTPLNECTNNNLIETFRAEADRMKGKIRMDFNETRTQPTNMIITQVRKRLQQDIYSLTLSEAVEIVSKDQMVPRDALLVCRGANHGLKRAILGLVKPGDRVVLPDITYIAHIKGLIGAGCNPIYVPVLRKQLDDPLSLSWDIESILQAIEASKPRMICITNPSNPLGEVLDADMFDIFINKVRDLSPDTIVLIDACFNMYGQALGFRMPDYNRYLHGYRIIVTGSLSKEDGYAGARAGFIYGSKEEIQVIKKTFPQDRPLSLLGASAICVARGPGMTSHRFQTVNGLIAENMRIRKEVCKLEQQLGFGIRTRSDTAASFTILMIPSIGVDEVIDWFKNHSNIDLSPVKRFNYTLSNAFRDPWFHVVGKSEEHLIRLSPGTSEQNDFFLSELAYFLQQMRFRCI